MFQTPLMTAIAAICVAAFANSASAAPVNVITNGDFEDGNTGFTSDLRNTRINCCAGSWIIAPHINHAFSGNSKQGSRGGDHTSGSGDALFVNGSTLPNSVFWRQTVAVNPDTGYTFSAWGMIWFGGGVATQLKINGTEVGNYVIDRFSSLDVWAEDTPTWNSGSATSATLELINASTGFSGNDFAVDDISFTGEAASPIPLPAGLPLLAAALGGLGLLNRRRAR